MLAARKQLDYYVRSGIDEAGKSADISTLAYENGEISYIEYVAALQQDIDTRLKYASAINDYNQAVRQSLSVRRTQALNHTVSF